MKNIYKYIFTCRKTSYLLFIRFSTLDSRLKGRVLLLAWQSATVLSFSTLFPAVAVLSLYVTFLLSLLAICKLNAFLLLKIDFLSKAEAFCGTSGGRNRLFCRFDLMFESDLLMQTISCNSSKEVLTVNGIRVGSKRLELFFWALSRWGISVLDLAVQLISSHSLITSDASLLSENSKWDLITLSLNQSCVRIQTRNIKINI